MTESFDHMIGKTFLLPSNSIQENEQPTPDDESITDSMDHEETPDLLPRTNDEASTDDDDSTYHDNISTESEDSLSSSEMPGLVPRLEDDVSVESDDTTTRQFHMERFHMDLFADTIQSDSEEKDDNNSKQFKDLDECLDAARLQS